MDDLFAGGMPHARTVAVCIPVCLQKRSGAAEPGKLVTEVFLSMLKKQLVIATQCVTYGVLLIFR